MAENKDIIPRIVFLASGLLFILTILLAPNTDCEACVLQSDDGEINGYEAFEIFEEACISYSKPWSQDYRDLEMTINLSEQFPIAEEYSIIVP